MRCLSVVDKVRIMRRHDASPIPRSRNSKARPAPGLNKWLSWALKLGLVGLVLLAGFAIYLDAVVQEKFSGRRWTIPAKVYARPLELFNGLKLSRKTSCANSTPSATVASPT